MPELLIDIEAIASNTQAVACLLKDRGLDLVAVTKGCLGDPCVASAMLAAGATALADTRDDNLLRLRAALPHAELHRINLPPTASAFVPGDVDYVSSWEAAEAVARVRGGTGLVSGRGRVMLQVETGDEREGVPPDHVLELAQKIAHDPRLELEGVSTNYACFKGSPEGIKTSVEAVAEVARLLRAAGLRVPRVSGGNSSVLWLVAQGEALPAEVTELRCGEVLLLGHDALYYEPLPGCRQDACKIRVEVLEEYTRPSAGGASRRLVLSAGHQDIGMGAVRFLDVGLSEIGRSSDYLVVEAGAASATIRVGSRLEMIPEYEALVAAWMSPYVDVKRGSCVSTEVVN